MNAIQRDKERDESAISRSFAIERLREKVDDKEVTVYRVSLSSENPIRDWPWAPPNVLIHDKAAVDLSGIAERGLPLFVNHRVREITSLVGRVVNLKLVNRRLVGDLRFSEANPEAAMVRGMVDEGTLTDMSITAEPIERKQIEKNGEVIRVDWTKWRPVEASVAGIGADPSVGIGRSSSVVQQSADAEGVVMTDEEKAAAEAKAKVERDAAARIEASKQQQDKEFAARAEDARIATIRKFGQTNAISEDTVQEWISRGWTYDQIADDIIAIHKKRAEAGGQSVAKLGLGSKETKQYSLSRAIVGCFDGHWKGAEFEMECSNEIAQRLGKIPEHRKFYVPMEVQQRPAPVDLDRLARVLNLDPTQIWRLQRDLNVATAGQGGFLVQTSIVGFDEILRNASFAYRMGVQRLPGLRDTIAIPRQTAAATAAWLANETSAIGESQQTFVQLSLSPKTVGAYTEVSRQLTLQSAVSVDNLLNQDLGAVVALAVDAAVLSGSGASGQPTGLDNTSGIGSVTGTSLAFDDILEFQTDVAGANVRPVRGGYVTTPAVASLCIQRVKYASTASPLWEGSVWEGTMQGFPAMATNQVAAATMYFGDWSKILVGEWGVLEIDTNPYANFAAGIIGVRAMYSVDVGVRYPAAFSRAGSIT